MSVITYNDLPNIRKLHNKSKIVFCTGVFDLTHVGHILFFEECKKLGDILVVAVGSDFMINRNKGSARPILNEKIRIKTVDSLKTVDYCLLEKSIPGRPLDHLKLAFKKLKPDLYVINKDASNIPYREKLIKEYPTKMVILDRSCPAEYEGISTTKIIEKIKSLL
mgnify:CR=1 FL=1